MAAQPTAGSQHKKRGIFPQWMRYVVLTIMVIAILACGFIWLRQVWGNVSDTIAAIFGIGGLLVGLLALPFFYPSHESEVTTVTGSTPPPQFQNIVNVYASQPDTHQLSSPTTANPTVISSPLVIGNTASNDVSQAMQESPAVNLPVAQTSTSLSSLRHEPQQRDKASQIDKKDLLDSLTGCNDAVFSLVVAYSGVREGLLPGDEAPQAKRASKLIQWAENNIGLQMLNEYYQRAEHGGKREPEEAYELPTWNAITLERDAENRGLEETLPNTLSDCVETAQWNVDQAYGLLDPELNILPEDIVNAAQNLENADGNIKHLEELLQKNPPHPKYGSIIDQVRIITDQINHYLIPDLRPSKLSGKDFRKRFGPLLNALKELDTLIPE